MRWLLLLLIISSTATAAFVATSDEQRVEWSDWVGRGVVSKVRFAYTVEGKHYWKATFHVTETLKGTATRKLVFLFEQDAPPKKLERFDEDSISVTGGGGCSSYPEVYNSEEVFLFLKREVRPPQGWFDKGARFFLDRFDFIIPVTPVNL